MLFILAFLFCIKKITEIYILKLDGNIYIK